MTSRQSPRDLRASDDDRDRVVTLLSDAAADGRLTPAELEERTGAAYEARTLGELAELTADLVPAAQQPIRLDGRRVVAALFGRDSRAGHWVVPEEVPVLAALGEAELDLREALLTARRTVVSATLLGGTLHVLVPEGVTVEVSGTAVLTRTVSRSVRAEPGARPAAEPGAVVEVRTSGFGGTVKVTSPRRPRRAGLLRRGPSALRGGGS